jgi:hypothetical protein
MTEDFITRGECERTHRASDSLLAEMRDDVKVILGRLPLVEADAKRGGSSIIQWIVGNWTMLARVLVLVSAIIGVYVAGDTRSAKVEEVMARTQRVAEAVDRLNRTVGEIIPSGTPKYPPPPIDTPDGS